MLLCLKGPKCLAGSFMLKIAFAVGMLFVSVYCFQGLGRGCFWEH